MFGRPMVLAAVALTALAATAISAATIPTQVGPDASAYLAVASLIRSGAGLVYPDGSPILGRSPLFAALVAFGGAAAPSLVPAAVVLSKLGFIAAAVLVAGLATRLAGPFAGLIAGLTLVVTPLFVWVSGSVLIDGLQAAACLAALWPWVSPKPPSWGSAAASGALLAAAVLIKESAVLWLVLPAALAFWNRVRSGHAVGAFYLAFGVAIAPWWLWVAAHTGRAWLVGLPAAVFVTALAVWLAGSFVAWRWATAPGMRLGGRLAALASERARTALIAGLLAIWVVAATFGLEAIADTDPQRSLPRGLYRYSSMVLAAQIPTLPWILAPLAIGLIAAARSTAMRAVLLATMCSIPLLLFIAPRGWDPRNLMLLFTAAAVLVGVGTVLGIDWIARSAARRLPAGVVSRSLAGRAIVVAALLALVVQPTIGVVNAVVARSAANSWDRPEVAAVVSWLEARTAPGETVLSSWQFAAMIAAESDGRLRVRQLPLIRVSLAGDATALLVRASTFNRWEDQRLGSAPVGPLVAAAQDADGSMVALERAAVSDSIIATGARWLVLVAGGPLLRDGANYPNLPALLGTGPPALEAAVGDARIEVYAIPGGAADRLVGDTAGPVALTANLAGRLVEGNDLEVRSRLRSLGISSVVITSAAAPSPALLDRLRDLGIPVSLAAG